MNQERRAEAAAFSGFDEAARAVLNHLRGRLALGLWMVTRTAGEDWVILEAETTHYDVAARDVFLWTDSFCSRMVQGEAPRAAPRSSEIAAYRDAPIGRQIPISAYVGVPLELHDGHLFGTLCAIDPEPQDERLESELPLIELLGRLLSTVAQKELDRQGEERSLHLEQLTPEHGILESVGWRRVLEAEEERCRVLASPASVIVVHPEYARRGPAVGASADVLAHATAEIVRSNLPADHPIAALDNAVAVLVPEADTSKAALMIGTLENALRDGGIVASFSSGTRTSSTSLSSAADGAGARAV